MGKLVTIVGLRYYEYVRLNIEIKEGSSIILKKDLCNNFDKNAISAWWEDQDMKQYQIGYVSRHETKDLKNIDRYNYKVVLIYKNVMIVEQLLKPEYAKKSFIKRIISSLKNRLTTYDISYKI